MASSSWSGYAAQPAAQHSSSAERSKKAQPRQLLSCTKCRFRKVKCDRTKPCSACCASGHPKECEFLVGEGNDYSPIQQSYEIRKLRQENLELKKEVQKLQHRIFTEGKEEEEEASPGSKDGLSVSRVPSTARQKRFKTGDKVDNLYFGTPGLASVVSDFASLQVGGHSLTHTLPRGKDFYASDDQPSYPFHVVDGRSSLEALVAILPEPDTLFSCLDSFQRRAQSCSFPHTPDEVTKKEVQRFLDSKEKNAELHPDMLALIFATVATGFQMGQYDRSGGRWNREELESMRRTSDAFISASMQALRLASFMNRPTLLAIQTLLMMGPYLTNSGRFLDAWTLFGTTIRLAHSIGLHRNPKHLDPVPSLRECTVRQSLWWWMLHLDQQYSVTLGRPLGITGYGDCPPPEPLTTNPTVLRLAEFVDHFTILSRQILSSDGMMNVGKIDEFTDKLAGLWDTMPAALQFNESWLRQTVSLPEWPLEMMSATLYAQVQSYIVLLNRQRVERTHNYSQRQSHSPPGHTYHTHRQHNANDNPTPNVPIRGRALVINSCISIIKAFLFFHYRNPGVLICWSIGQQAFNACMILLLDALEAEDQTNEWLVAQAFAVFRQLEQNGVHRLAELAVQRISDGLLTLGHMHAGATQHASRRTSEQHPQQPQLSLDTASMMDWTGDTVMGNTGTFLLEDPGLQLYHPSAQPFRPLSWAMAGTSSSSSTTTTTPHSTQHPSQAQSTQHSPLSPSSSTGTATATTTPLYSHHQTVPVSQVSAAPFPIMASPPFIGAGAPAIPVTNSPFAVGLQPRLTGLQGQGFGQQSYLQQGGQQRRQRQQQGQGQAQQGMVYHGLPTTSTAADAFQAQGFAQGMEQYPGFATQQHGCPAPAPQQQQQQQQQRASGSRQGGQSSRSRAEVSRSAGRSAQRRR